MTTLAEFHDELRAVACDLLAPTSPLMAGGEPVTADWRSWRRPGGQGSRSPSSTAAPGHRSPRSRSCWSSSGGRRRPAPSWAPCWPWARCTWSRRFAGDPHDLLARGAVAVALDSVGIAEAALAATVG